jgi:cytochrome c peroxidase
VQSPDFDHDGRFATLEDVIEHYNQHLNLGLTTQEKVALVQHLKSL